jgi:hypothetical protein
MKSLKESILSSTKSGKYSTPVKWSKEFESLIEAKKAFLDFYDITNPKVRDYIDYVFDIYNREYGWPSSFVFDLDFEEKAKHQGIKSFNPKIYTSSFTGNRYIIVYVDKVYYIWDDVDECFDDIFDTEFLEFIEKD